MNSPFITLGLAKTGAVFQGKLPATIPPALLSGLAEVPVNQGDAFHLIVIPPGLGTISCEKKPLLAWLPPDVDGRVGERQIQLAEELGCLAVFAGDTALENPAIYQIANYPGRLQPLEMMAKKPFPMGLIGRGFHFGTEPDPLYPWRAAVAEPLLKTFPSLSYLPETPEKAREFRSKCDLAVLCGGLEGRFLPEFLEILLHGSCLVTERSPILEKLGFVDGVNCLFITADRAVAKCAGLLGDPERLQRMQMEGQKLARKIVKNSGREIIRSWWEAHRAGKKLVSEIGMNHRPRRWLDWVSRSS